MGTASANAAGAIGADGDAHAKATKQSAMADTKRDIAVSGGAGR